MRSTSSEMPPSIRGRPRLCRGYVQRRATSWRCQRKSVTGDTRNDDHSGRGSERLSAASSSWSAGHSRGRPTRRCKTCSWWPMTCAANVPPRQTMPARTRSNSYWSNTSQSRRVCRCSNCTMRRLSSLAQRHVSDRQCRGATPGGARWGGTSTCYPTPPRSDEPSPTAPRELPRQHAFPWRSHHVRNGSRQRMREERASRPRAFARASHLQLRPVAMVAITGLHKCSILGHHRAARMRRQRAPQWPIRAFGRRSH
jgi:hypothetical protein